MISLKSEITSKLLHYFFINPNDSLYVNEIVRQLNVDKRNLIKKIKELENEGLMQSTKRGNLKLYSINQSYPLYNEYRNIIIKTVGIENQIKEILVNTKGVEKAFIYGSYAKNEMDVHSDIDLLVVGNQNIVQLHRKLNKLQKLINREINVLNMDSKELIKRQKTKDQFIINLLNKNIRIVE